jgi:hypothetical protein
MMGHVCRVVTPPDWLVVDELIAPRVAVRGTRLSPRIALDYR